MSENHLEPAKTIIAKAGGPDKVAAITGRHVSRVYRWMCPRESGGTGGLIPFKHVPALIEDAKKQGNDLSADDFLPEKAGAA